VTESCSLACSRVSQFPRRVPFCRMLRTSVRPAASSYPIRLSRLASPTILRTAERRTLIVEGDKDSMPARHSISNARERGRLAVCGSPKCRFANYLAHSCSDYLAQDRSWRDPAKPGSALSFIFPWDVPSPHLFHSDPQSVRQIMSTEVCQ
jgi:hypothetical protein